MFSDGRPSVDTTATATRPSTEIRQLNIRKNTDTSARVPPPPEPRPQAKDAAARMVIRRTIILPDPKASNVDWAALARKQSTSRRRRSAGAGSTQSKGSVQDRVPTPPPNRATLKRFSNDSSPPMPHIQSFSSQLDASTSSQMEKSNSAYDSLYDMYDDRAPDPQGPSGSQMYQEDATGDGMPAVEVVELANGDTIWSIVNGLRDDDVESYFGGERASFASEYSARDEGVKISFKEHGRKSSKSSNNSLLGRKKPQGVNRPETKVFYSSSAQIGRLIENISRGADSGSFNIAPEQQVAGYAPVGHSASSSVGSDADMRWTVEERLEHMLGKIAADH
ncbi:hypothetical protein EUX98_g1207 [Antrodiella citrinella]|uniref:Uncharacterized protein n=1 Tax=Antrodiella citrinella TaxID=2447956 RepID=A0A4S4N4Y5_9APHY|nr:hypothetical protein EUX98_g1207 [Antrodiella citrinella]